MRRNPVVAWAIRLARRKATFIVLECPLSQSAYVRKRHRALSDDRPLPGSGISLAAFRQ